MDYIQATNGLLCCLKHTIYQLNLAKLIFGDLLKISIGENLIWRFARVLQLAKL